MKKVGIMSMQRIYNYGSFLQAYGLKSLIEELGCKVEFVDYHIGDCLVKETENYKKNKIVRMINKVIDTINQPGPLREKIAFITFKKNYAKRYYPLLEITKTKNYLPSLDVLVIGSDEVFNCIQDNSNVGYSLELFGKDHKCNKLISYAASCGNTTVEKLKKFSIENEVGYYLNKFNAISVRDENTRNVVDTLSDQVPEAHLDPVLVYDYMTKCSDIPKRINEKNYIILYGYSGRMTHEECMQIKHFAHDRKLKIICIGGVQECCDKFISCSPFEVLGYFRNASYVITDTFHGTIFSIITKRQFVTITRKSKQLGYGNEEKITDLLKRLKLESRLINHIKNLSNELDKTIDYKDTYEILDKERKKTSEYLRREIIGR